MKKITAVKPCGAGNFSVTRYHIAEALVDREVNGEQVINSQVFVLQSYIYVSLHCIHCLDISC